MSATAMALLGEDAVRRGRIVKHMNTDHKVSLCAFAKLPPYANVQMTDIKLDSISLVANGKPITIPLEPPMTSFDESRQRLASMSAKSCKLMGYSHYVINDYVPPNIFGVMIATFVLLGLRAFSDPVALRPEGWAREIFFFGNETLSDFCLKYSPQLFWTIVAIHVTEAAWFWKSKILYYHCTSWVYRVIWTINVLVEGFGCFSRFNALIEEKKFKHMR